LLGSTLSGTALAVLPSGHIAKITAADRSTTRGRTNVVFHVVLSAAASSHPPQIGRSAHTHIPGLAGRNSAWLQCCQQVRRYCRQQDWVMLEGEKGSGRARLAQAVGQYVKPGRTVRVMRAETFPSPARFVAELATLSGDEDCMVVIADVDDIDNDTLEPIASLLASRAGRGWIAATKSGAPPSALIKELLLPLFTHTVTVPPLRHRIDDLEELVPLLLREITRGTDVRLAPDAMRQLGRLPWPGNVSQLRRVLTETVARQRSGSISADKLPPECRSLTRRKLTQMEALERDAIVRNLQDNGGNKQDAARALGMSRATIYRKINDYGIA
jgi:transcriptional regulator of acetoin/glycerol metabolism